MISNDGKVYFRSIPGLMVPRAIKYEAIHSDINKFIDLIPELTEKLENNFLNKRYEFVIKNMELALSLLRNVYARWLETEGSAILRRIKNDDAAAVLWLRLKSFISDLASLSIEMQKAQNAESEEAEETVSESEAHADMAKNLSAVGELIDGGEYESAQSMIEEMEEYNQEVAFVELLDLVMSKKYGEAEVLACKLKEKHLEAISQVSEANQSKKILAVDDRPEILSFISGALKGHYKVFGVTGGKAALKVMESQSPDLFILDIDMPEMDGYQLAGIVRSTAGHELTPIIFLTGNSSREHVLKAIKAGCNDFIVKPTSHDNLLVKVGKYLN